MVQQIFWPLLVKKEPVLITSSRKHFMKRLEIGFSSQLNYNLLHVTFLLSWHKMFSFGRDFGGASRSVFFSYVFGIQMCENSLFLPVQKSSRRSTENGTASLNVERYKRVPPRYSPLEFSHSDADMSFASKLARGFD